MRQKRVLPWREAPTLYRVWISEIMLQQTQVATVIPYFERFIKRFPDVETLARAEEDDVLLHWAGLGYYSRARNLYRAAKQIFSEGGFPKCREGWLSLPGIGPYTAGAILSIALDQPEPILDGNVERVLSRVRRVGREEGDVEFKSRLWKLSLIFVEKGFSHSIRPSVLNQALMELGATVCTPGNPKCSVCPLAGICQARVCGEVESFPPRKPAKKWVQVHEELHCVLAEVVGVGSIMLRRRRKGEWREGLWDLLESAPVSKAVNLGIVETRHVVTNHKIFRKTQVWKLEDSQGWGVAEPDSELRWFSLGSDELPMGSALRKTLEKVREMF